MGILSDYVHLHPRGGGCIIPSKAASEKRQHLLSVAACFPWTLQMAWQFVEASIPHKAWFFLFSSHQKEAWNRRDGRETFQSV